MNTFDRPLTAEKRTAKVWFNVYEPRRNLSGGNVAEFIGFVAPEDARRIEDERLIARIEREITFEVGEGL